MEPVSTRLRDDAPTEEALSLVGRAEQIFRHGQAEENAAPVEARVYPDGYARRSPHQAYRVPEGYYRRLAWRAALYAVAAVLLALLVVTLMKRKILRF